MSELYNSHTDSLHFSKMYEQFYEKQPTRIYLSKTQLSSSDLLGSNQQEAFEVHQSFFEFLKLYLLVAEWEWTIVNKQNDFTVYYLKLRFVEKDAELCLTTKLFNDGRHYVTKIEQFSVVEDILKCIRKH